MLRRRATDIITFSADALPISGERRFLSGACCSSPAAPGDRHTTAYNLIYKFAVLLGRALLCNSANGQFLQIEFRVRSVRPSVRPSVSNERVLWKNGRFDRHVARGGRSSEHKKPRIRWRFRSADRKGQIFEKWSSRAAKLSGECGILGGLS